KWINSTSPQDTLIVYYAGHGISKDGEFYFIPSDADIEDSFTWISFKRLKSYINEIRKIIWLIDACYSGSIVKGRPLRAVKIQKEAFEIEGEQVIITSSTGNEISQEMPDGSGGIFTVALVEALKGDADSDKDGWIESGELYEYVKEKVIKLSEG
ncbi:MAG: caspase family protein, partial [Thermotogaceae bacterium]|nr:caspase family protein [Thermotogaceae bacterium]